VISSTYKLRREIIDKDYSPFDWNIYPFPFSDGDNWSREDSIECLDLMQQAILPKINMFCYAQLESPYGSDQFSRDVNECFDGVNNAITSQIANRGQIYDAIKAFLGNGK
jgi:uncharacterized sporulation protein YeaH/YhbH (DUF444 family)